MSSVPLDTHEVVKELKAAGFTDEQAEAVTRVVRNAQIVDLSNLATKVDLAALKSDLELGLAAAKSGLAALKSDLQLGLAATKVDLAALRSDLQLGLAAAKSDLAGTKAEILKWMVSAIGIQTVVIIGAVIALVRMGPHQ